MDLLFICDTPPYPHTSTNAVLPYHLARTLAERHHIIDLVCFYNQPEDLAEVPRYESYFRDVFLVPKPILTKDMLEHRIKEKSHRFANTIETAWSGEMWTKISHLVETRRYDVVQCMGDVLVYEYRPLMQRLSSVITVPQFRSDGLSMRMKATNGWQQRRRLRREYDLMRDYEKWMFHPFDKVVVSTKHQVDDLMQRVDIAAIQIPVGVDIDYYTPTGMDAESPALLFIGDFRNSVEHEAALDLCQNIFPAIHKSIPDAKLYIVGEPITPQLKALASENIIMVGAVLDLRPYFELATLYMSPLKQPIGIRENILRSLSMMTPVVGTSVSFEGLQLERDQHVVLGDNTDELIRRAIRLLKDDQERLRLQINGLERIQKAYSWLQVAIQYETLFSALS